MNNKILEDAQKVIDMRRYSAENKAVNDKIKALENEKFKKAYNSYMTSMINDTREGKDLSESTINSKQNLDDLAKKLGVKIYPNYHCKKCNDNGRINGGYCDCLKSEINKILISQSGFNNLESFDTTSFDSFEDKEFKQKTYRLMKDWCHSNSEKNLLFIAGETGVGKTHLMRCIANELISLNKIVTLTTSFAMNQDFAKSYASRDDDEKNELLDKYLDTEILFIDDLGTELRRPGVTVNYLYLILNERKVNNKPTVITSNLTLEDLRDYYDERILSRIADQKTSICIYIKGKDLRQQK